MEALVARLRDDRDQGLLIMTPAYLLIGCVGPLWLSWGQGRFEPRIEWFAGFISIGIGDTAAALVGKRFVHSNTEWLQEAGTLISTRLQLWSN